jgi:hypothetical protein
LTSNVPFARDVMISPSGMASGHANTMIPTGAAFYPDVP